MENTLLPSLWSQKTPRVFRTWEPWTFHLPSDFEIKIRRFNYCSSPVGEMPWKCHHVVAGKLPGDSPDLETSNLPDSAKGPPRRLVACGSGGASCEGIGCGGEAYQNISEKII